MEQVKVTLKTNLGVFSVEEIVSDLDKENVYVLFAVCGDQGEWELSVGASPAADRERVYISVTDRSVQEVIIQEALPILINALEIKAMSPESQEDLLSYREAIKQLSSKRL
ncbi:hypothetical protein [Paenibacillus eucommiae]|uniref:IDEAL domain-containing protein n=1 Tax=Paenibacillus eucommiae TaxID=1355755 RepID=A0ABS4IUU4_9BACL|nr:hypothetical protein [Paenibacillus eucommiae]MBP1990344.1 hypothetical protein [Paenibacillus eucommiae]